MLIRAIRVLIPACVLIFALTVPAAAQASLTVNSSTDATDFTLNGQCSVGTATGGACTLRAAIQEANNNADSTTITISVAIITLTGSAADDTTAATGDLDITSPVSIDGNSAVIVSTMSNRVFQVVSGSLDVNDLQVIGVRTTDNGGAFLASINTSLLLNHVHINHNTAGNGAAVLASNGTTVNIINSSITNNTGNDAAVFNSGASTFTVLNSTISSNTGTTVGGIHNISNTGDFSRYEQVTVTENLTLGTTASSAGGIFTEGDFGPVFQNSILSDNARRFSGLPGIDCATNLASNHLISQGGNVFGSLQGCTVAFAGDRDTFDGGLEPLTEQIFSGNAFHVPKALSPALFLGQLCQPEDQNGNPRPLNNCTAGAVEAPLLLINTNGGFENGLQGWTVSGTGAKAKTTDPRSGLKHLELKGSSTSTRTLTQKINIDSFSDVPEFVVVDLFYQPFSGTSIMSISLEFKRDFGEKVKLTLPVVDESGSERAASDYDRATYRLLVDNGLSEDEILTGPRAAHPPSSVTIKLIDKSKSGKLFVDDVMVYFYGGDVQPGSSLRNTGTRGAPLLPPPLVPAGFRK